MHIHRYFCILRVACGLLALAGISSRSNAAITVLNYWRMGEADPGAVLGGSVSTTIESVNASNLLFVGASSYSTNTAPAAAAHTGSSFSIDLNATGAYGICASISTNRDNFGMEFWARPAFTNDRTLVYNGNTATTGWGIITAGGKYSGLFGGQDIFGTAAVITNVWTHLALVRTNGIATLYVNGVAAGTSAVLPNPPAGFFAVGVAPQSPATASFLGAIDELRVFTFTAGQFSTNDLLLNAPGTPIVSTSFASNVTNLTATLNGKVVPNNFSTAAWFEWGAVPGFENVTAVTNIGNGLASAVIKAGIAGLQPGQSYYYRAMASNSWGRVMGWKNPFVLPRLTLPAGNNIPYLLNTPFTNPVSLTASPLAIDAGFAHNLLLKADGTVVSWGLNDNFQTNVPPDLTNAISIAAGDYHNLALKADGTVVGWGYPYALLNQPPGLTNVVAIAAGDSHSLALRSDGTVVAWGDDSTGSGDTNVPPGLNGVAAIAAGFVSSYALKTDGTVVGWGDSGTAATNIPVGLSNVVAISGGYAYGMALKRDGTVAVWGFGGDGETNIPPGLNGVVAIAAGTSHCLALLTNGTVVAWGNNQFGQTNVPAGLTNVIAIAAGNLHSMALKADGTLVGWGTNNYGQLDLPTGLANLSDSVTISGTLNTSVPGTYPVSLRTTNLFGAISSTNFSVIVGLPPSVTASFASNINSASATLNASIYPGGALASGWFEWGSSRIYGNSTVPVNIGNGNTPAALNTAITGLQAGKVYHYHARASNLLGSVMGWDNSFVSPIVTLPNGNSYTNLLGASFTNPTVALTAMPLAIAAGETYNVVLKGDGKVIAWGAGNVNTTNVPPGLTNVIAISAAYAHTLALKKDGTVVAWGFNSSGQTNIPPGLNNVVAIAAGYYHNVALKSDGTVIAWGANDQGQTNVPVGLNNAVAVGAGRYGSMAVKADGTVIVWGSNVYGETNVPPGLSNVVAITSGAGHCLALKSDGSVAAWGFNSEGQATVPSNVTNVVAISAHDYQNLVLRADGTVVAWGEQTYSATNLPPSLTNVVAIATGAYHAAALRADGTMIDWGFVGWGVENIPPGLTNPSGSVSVSGTVNTNLAGNYTLTFTTTNFLGAINSTTATVTVPPPVLQITRGSAGSATLSWSPPATGYLLQESTNLSSAAWINSLSGPTNPTAIGLTNSGKFYRLHLP